jgi:hypothetical protein
MQVEPRKPRSDARTAPYAPPGPRIDGRTRAGRRITALIDAITGTLGGDVDGVTQAQVERVAELSTIVETARAEMLQGNNGRDLGQLAKLEGELAAAWALLGLPPRNREHSR